MLKHCIYAFVFFTGMHLYFRCKYPDNPVLVSCEETQGLVFVMFIFCMTMYDQVQKLSSGKSIPKIP